MGDPTWWVHFIHKIHFFPSFKVKNGQEKNPQICGVFSCFPVFSSFLFLPFFALVFLISLCFSTSWSLKRYPPGGVCGIHISCRVKTWSKYSLFLSQKLVQFFSVFLFCFSIFTCLKICRNHYFYSVFSQKMKIAHPKKLKNTICEHNCFFCPFFSAFLLFSVFAVSGFFEGSFLRRMKKKTKKTKFKTKQKRKDDHKMQTTKPLSPVFKEEKSQTTQTQYNTNQMSKMETNNTRKKQTRTNAWNWKTINYLVTNMTKKH